MTEPVKVAHSGASGRVRLHGLHVVDILILLLLVTGFFLGPLKMLGLSWLSYLGADVLAVLVIVVVFGERISNRKPLFAASSLSVPILLLAGLCVLELANPEAPFLRSVLGLRSWMLYLTFYFVGLYILRSVEQLERLYVLLLVLGLLTAAYGVYQWQAGPQSFATWSDYYGRYAALAWSARSGGVVFRAFSSFSAAGTFGGNMALLMLLAFSVAASPRIGPRWRIAGAATFAAMGAGIAVSGSRGPVVQLMLAAGIALAFIPGVRSKLAVMFKAGVLVGAAVTLIAFVVGPVVSERFSTIFDPQAFFWKWFGPLTGGVGIAQAHPFGMGLGYTAGVPQFIPNPAFQGLGTTGMDSGYGSAAAELGLLGLGLFVYFAVKVGVDGFRTWRRLPSGRLRDLLLGPALIAATYPLVSVIYQPQASLPSSIYSWLLIGMLMKAPSLQRQIDAEQILPSHLEES